jgi:hypothetical protein
LAAAASGQSRIKIHILAVLGSITAMGGYYLFFPPLTI